MSLLHILIWLYSQVQQGLKELRPNQVDQNSSRWTTQNRTVHTEPHRTEQFTLNHADQNSYAEPRRPEQLRRTTQTRTGTPNHADQNSYAESRWPEPFMLNHTDQNSYAEPRRPESFTSNYI